MSRHGRHVPTSFYRRFARDALSLAHKYAQGRLIGVLEGGYSDRALTSGVMSWLAGMTEGPGVSDTTPVKQELEAKPLDDTTGRVDESWWNIENLVAVSLTLYTSRVTLMSPNVARASDSEAYRRAHANWRCPSLGLVATNCRDIFLHRCVSTANYRTNTRNDSEVSP